MKETKQAPATPEARAALHEMMAAFEAFKGANDARLEEVERKASADTLLEEKVARIDQAVASAQARLDRVLSESRRPPLGVEPKAVEAPEAKAAFDGYLRAGGGLGLELKAGLSSASNSAGYVVPEQTERAIERRLTAGSPMREIASVRTVQAGVFRKPVSISGVGSGWVAETAGRPGDRIPQPWRCWSSRRPDLYACPAATQSLLDDALVDLDEWLAAEVEGRVRGAGDPGLRQRRWNEQAPRLPELRHCRRRGSGLGRNRLCRLGRGRRLRGGQPDRPADRSDLCAQGPVPAERPGS